MTQVVTFEKHGDIATICIDNPPVNAAGHAMRQGVVDALDALEVDSDIKAIALYCAGRTFVAGADIREFGKPSQPPVLPDVCNRIEACSKPIVAILHGTALGGGLEVALCCHARVAQKGAKVGLPEVHLGLLPGSGGTIRLPRLTDTATTIKMVTGGAPISAEEALEKGVIDRIVDGDPAQTAVEMAKELRDGKLNARVTRDIPVELDATKIASARAKFSAKGAGGAVALRALRAVESATKPVDEALADERALFIEALASEEHHGLKHAFFAERAVANIPEAKATAREINAVGVIGGGTMGSGIATSLLLAGLPVTVIEMAEERVAFATKTITANLQGAVSRGKLSEAAFDATIGRLVVTTDMQTLAGADLVIEAVFESMEVKHDVFGKLDDICKDGAILASNTSYLNIDKIAAAVKRPQDVIGLHFFSPAHVMRLLEVVVGAETADDVVATGFALAKRLRKVAVRAGVCDGFIGNRILAHYARSTGYMMMDGADYEQIDNALVEFGAAMGPFTVGDLSGLDIGWAERKRRAPLRPSQERYVGVADKICEAGDFGRKTGKGYYVYWPDGSKTKNPNVAKYIAEEQVAKGITPRSFTNAEIVDRYITAMIVESTRVVEEGIALRPIDVDAVFLFGYGFPRHRGGPLCYADRIGAANLVERIKTYAHEDPFYWQVPKLLQKLADDNTTFADLNKER
ncbi:3-hydroxyacyl-CoA dehydrogenase NAD-binding domain-containing protein [Loktanella sp. S4079]|uniref:3-hydroxyacyl-CoA dehydrogenase NAD-binding domain-containing protein n=1 Tax=Loktanella sp. S4079 TaxID=579483 RepID=UPI0005F9B87E|nr:3-hydroxyacyl-CoA dehydrogenase NAD-binding domain-containing protein [Loktanella sp. S4079]KJZ18652.1 3-hydroxyacyl-CoA dehydrogenase [Loktanella sp. S4079]